MEATAGMTDAVRHAGRLETYGLAYASGIIWLSIAAVLLGSQQQFSFTPAYDFLLAFPPFAAATTMLLVDPRGKWRTYPLRVLLMAVAGGILSACTTVVLAPLLVIMFRGGVTGDLGITGAIASVVLVIVASPLVVAAVRAFRDGSFGKLALLAVGLLVTFVSLAMTLDPTGPLASSMRLDQARIMMVVSAWWLPAYAATAAFLRESELI